MIDVERIRALTEDIEAAQTDILVATAARAVMLHELRALIDQPAGPSESGPTGEPEPVASPPGDVAPGTKREQSGTDHGRRPTRPKSAGSIPASRSTSSAASSIACDWPECEATFTTLQRMRSHRSAKHVRRPTEPPLTNGSASWTRLGQ